MNLGLNLMGGKLRYNLTFGSLINVPLDSVIISRKVRIITPGVIEITAGIGEYQINGGLWVSTTGTVEAGDLVRVRVTSSALYETEVTLEIAIDGVADVFSVTTVAETVAEGFPYEFPFILE